MEDLVTPSPEFWRGKRVLLTGHTGFKGSWLALWLHEMGAHVTGIALPPATRPNLYEAAGIGSLIDSTYLDVRNGSDLTDKVRQVRPDIVLHLAAQALVRTSYADPASTYAVNVMGTVNVLEALRTAGTAKAVVMVTTDKVYRNREWSYPYRECDELGGHDPYSASKAASEIVISSYRDAFLGAQGVAVASARAGNVIGGGDWSADRILPDAIRAWQSGDCLHVRRPDAVRPWQHVLEPVAGYLRLAETLWESPELAGSYNFGPDAGATASVRTVVDLALKSYGRGSVDYAEVAQGPHEAGLLLLDPSLSRSVLKVRERWDLPAAVARSIRWYRQFADGANPLELCLADIRDYVAKT
ncbi:CDP-glucose 4,6-dehydratase [Achromobacter spanius]|uniref:CDP-glucose 4,6-dehydratase n=1 Tax=Achromobacter spanius TaxID=217203 RepID=UPI0032099278